METYKNPFTEKEDETLFELHEIRHSLQQKNISADELNKKALNIFNSWHNKNTKKKSA